MMKLSKYLGIITIIIVINKTAIVAAQNTPMQEDNKTLETMMSIYDHEIKSLQGRIELLENHIKKLQQQIYNLSVAIEKKPTEIQPSHDKVKPSTPKNPPIINSNTENKVGKKQEQNIKSTTFTNTEQENKDYSSALEALQNKNFGMAEEKFSSFMKKHPKSNLLSKVYFFYAETFYRRDNHEKAALNYLKGYKEFPQGDKAPESLLKLALSLKELGKTKEACLILNKLNEQFPKISDTLKKRASQVRLNCECR